MNACATIADDHAPALGLMRWTTTNHKDIGTLYLGFSLIVFFIGGFMALIVIFGVVMPAFVGLANWMVPMMIGTPGMTDRPQRDGIGALPAGIRLTGGGAGLGRTFTICSKRQLFDKVCLYCELGRSISGLT